jgi:hypothetical protein
MSMAVTEASAPIARLAQRARMAGVHAIDHLSQRRVQVVVFIVVSFRFCAGDCFPEGSCFASPN